MFSILLIAFIINYKQHKIFILHKIVTDKAYLSGITIYIDQYTYFFKNKKSVIK